MKVEEFNRKIDEFVDSITQPKDFSDDEDTQSTVLRACPFCGGRARLNFGKSLTRINHEGLAQSFDSYIVECTECGVQTCFYKEAPDAIDAWNKRVY